MITGGEYDELDPAKETRDYYARAKRDARSFAEESERIRAEYQTELKAYLKQKFEAQCQAASHASNIGLRYHPRSNRFTIPVIPHEPAPDPKLDPNEIETILNADGSYSVLSRDDVTQDDVSSTSGPESDHPEADEQEIDGTVSKAALSVQDNNSPIGEIQEESVELSKYPIERPKRPELPNMPPPPDPPKPDDGWKRNSNIKSAIAWTLSLFVGAFIGYGLKTFIGASLSFSKILKDVACIILGISVIGGLKLLMDILWGLMGSLQARQALNKGLFSFGCIVSFLLIGAEATLGAKSLVALSSNMSFGGTDRSTVLPFELALLMTVCISTATLVFSGVIGYQKGLHSLTAEDAAYAHFNAQKQVHENECNRLLQEHERDLREWQETKEEFERIARERVERQLELERLFHDHKKERIQSIHAGKMALANQLTSNSERELEDHIDGVVNGESRRSDFASMRKLPDFQAMLKFMSLVDAYSLRIEELENRQKNELISRGHRRAELL